MEKIDARKHSPETQYEIRKQVVRLRKQGFANRVVAEGVGISEGRASKIWQAYIKGGIKAITPGKRGRRKGDQRTLSSDQETEIKKALIDKTPDQLKFPFALWTRKAVQELMHQWYGMTMPIRTVGEYLGRWGFTPQKPIKKAREQNSKAVEQWLKTEYPKIDAHAKKEKAEIYWGDETGIQNEANRIRGYAPSGKTPLIKISAKKERINMMSAINNEGKVRFMMYKESMTSDMLIVFMKRLIKDAGRKVYLILDNLKVHHSKKVTGWVESNRDKIEIFYLPSYSPELNPDEYLNGDLKGRVHSGTQAHSVQDLKHRATSFMRKLVKRPHHVRNYFKHPKVAYAG